MIINIFVNPIMFIIGGEIYENEEILGEEEIVEEIVVEEENDTYIELSFLLADYYNLTTVCY